MGVVRPYAVVEIEGIRQLSNARSVKARSLAPSSSQLSSSILRRRAPTCFPLPTGGSHKNADTVTSIPGNSIPPKPRATPRRKVPQPPLPRQMNKSPHTNLAVVSEANGKTAKSIDQNRVSPAIDKRDEGAVMEPAVLLSARCTAVSENKLQELEAKRLQVSRAAGRVVAALRSKPKLKVLQEGISTVSSSGRVEEPAVVLSTVRGKRTAPKKPPRTPSTFLEFADKLSQSASGNSKENTLSNSHLDSYSNWLQAQLAKLMEDVVQRVYAKFLELVLRPDPMWKVSWQQLQLLSPNTAIYKGVEMSLQASTYSTHTNLDAVKFCIDVN